MKYDRQDKLIKILLKYFKGIAPIAIYDMVETLWPRDSGDEKVKFDIGDPVSGYLWDKVKAGPGVILTEGEGTDANKVIISAPGGGTPLDIVAGDGMDFVTNTSVKLGTPSTVDKTTTNSVTTHSHTHQLGHVYDWKLHSPDQIVGDLDEPENIIPSIDGTGAVSSTIPAGTYAIVAINAAGETLPVDVPEMVIKEDTTAVVVSWDAVPGATAYKVYEVSTGLYYDLISNVWLYLTQTPATAGTLPTTNTALVYQSEFTIDDADIVKIIGDGIDIETYAEPGDSTIKVVKIIKQRSDWNATEGPNVIDNKPTIPENTDEKVKYDAADPAAGYLSEKIVAGTNITIEEGTGADENKLVINATGEAEEGWQEWTFDDVVPGTAKDYVIHLKVKNGYTIDSIVLQTDNGTLTGCSLKINGVAVTGMSAITINTTISETAATGANTAVAGDLITFHITTGYTGAPTLVHGLINYTRT